MRSSTKQLWRQPSNCSEPSGLRGSKRWAEPRSSSGPPACGEFRDASRIPTGPLIQDNVSTTCGVDVLRPRPGSIKDPTMGSSWTLQGPMRRLYPPTSTLKDRSKTTILSVLIFMSMWVRAQAVDESSFCRQSNARTELFAAKCM